MCGVELGRKTCSGDKSGEVGRELVSSNDAFGTINEEGSKELKGFLMDMNLEE